MSTIIAPDVLRAAAPAAAPSAAQPTDPAAAFAAVLDRTVAAVTDTDTAPANSSHAALSESHSPAPSPGPEVVAALLAALLPAPAAPPLASGQPDEPTSPPPMSTAPGSGLGAIEALVAAAPGRALAEPAPVTSRYGAAAAGAVTTVPLQPPPPVAQAAGQAGSPAPAAAAAAADPPPPQQAMLATPLVADRLRASAGGAPHSALAPVPSAPNTTYGDAPATVVLAPTSRVTTAAAMAIPAPAPSAAVMPPSSTAPSAASHAGTLERPAHAPPDAPALVTAGAGPGPTAQHALPQSAGAPAPAVTANRAEQAPAGEPLPSGADAHLAAALHAVRQGHAGSPSRFEIAAPVQSTQWPAELGERILVLPRNQEVELHLRPADLGPLRVRISLQDGQTQLNFVSDSPVVRHTLEAALPQLRSSLAENGINVGQASVGAGSGEARAQHQSAQDGSAGRQQPQEQMHESAGAPAAAGAQQPPSGRAADGVIDTFA